MVDEGQAVTAWNVKRKLFMGLEDDIGLKGNVPAVLVDMQTEPWDIQKDSSYQHNKSNATDEGSKGAVCSFRRCTILISYAIEHPRSFEASI